MEPRDFILMGMKLIHEGCKDMDMCCDVCPLYHVCPNNFGDEAPSLWTDSFLKGEKD